MKYELYEVGGRVRDKFLGLPSNDVDYTVVLQPTKMQQGDLKIQFALFVTQIKKEGYRVHVEYPETLTVKAKFPEWHALKGLDADFVVARKELGYIQGTRQPNVVLGTLMDDLERRDFTVNAMAEDIFGVITDPFDGQGDLLRGILRTPSDTVASFNDDPLRVMRAMRFAITKNLNYSDDIVTAIKLLQPEKMAVVSTERIRKELQLMFKHDTSLSLRYLRWLEDMNPKLYSNIIREGLWLLPTTKQ